MFSLVILNILNTVKSVFKNDGSIITSVNCLL